MKKNKQKSAAAGKNHSNGHAPKKVDRKPTGAYWAECIAIIAFLLLWGWFVGKQSGWWMSGNKKGVNVTPTASVSPAGTDQGTAGTTGTGGGTGGGGGTGTNTNGRSTSTSTTTNNSSTTNNTTNNGGGGGGGGGGDNGGTTPNLLSVFLDSSVGEAKATVLGRSVGITPNCITTNLLVGTQDVCTLSVNGQSVIFTFLNNVLVTKVKVGL